MYSRIFKQMPFLIIYFTGLQLQFGHSNFEILNCIKEKEKMKRKI